MKITRRQLRQIIKEEMNRSLLKEGESARMAARALNRSRVGTAYWQSSGLNYSGNPAFRMMPPAHIALAVAAGVVSAAVATEVMRAAGMLPTASGEALTIYDIGKIDPFYSAPDVKKSAEWQICLADARTHARSVGKVCVWVKGNIGEEKVYVIHPDGNLTSGDRDQNVMTVSENGRFARDGRLFYERSCSICDDAAEVRSRCHR